MVPFKRTRVFGTFRRDITQERDPFLNPEVLRKGIRLIKFWFNGQTFIRIGISNHWRGQGLEDFLTIFKVPNFNLFGILPRKKEKKGGNGRAYS